MPKLRSSAFRQFCTIAILATSILIATSANSFAQDLDNDGLAGAADPCPTEPRNLCAGQVAIDASTLLPVRINATKGTGAECYGTKIDCNDDVWASDYGYNFAISNIDCNVGGTGEACVISGISDIFGCDDEETEDIFQCEHFDDLTNGELEYTFNLPNGRYIVNLFFANIRKPTNAVGSRVFDIYVEGNLAYNNFDQVAAAGGTAKAVVRSVDVTVTDGNGLNIEFGHVTNDPAIKAIEVIEVGCTTASDCNDGNVCTTENCVANICQYSNNSASCNDGLACTTSDNCSAGFCNGISNCPSGQSCNAQTGVCDAQSVSFGKSQLQGVAPSKPTTLDFGPDGRLYVSQQNGTILAYTIGKNGPNNYVATATETINLVKNIPNYNDDGSAAPSQTQRLVTGFVAAGTAANPILYVASSDPRIGGGANSTDKNLDTNSGTISRLTWNGNAWVMLHLVRGLSRSEENHTGNGVILDPTGTKLYVAYGGNTNMGAPSNNFVFLPEYALSAAILSIDLAAIGNTTYDIPTLDDEDKVDNMCSAPAASFGLSCTANSECDSSPGSGNGRCDMDVTDPFGGNNGKNQAKLIPGGPVQVYAPGFRNPYDIVITQGTNRMYTIDNGPNSGWGDMPINEGPAGNCTNGISEPGSSHKDNLHYVTGPGFYGGHPNPTRARMANTFNATNPQSPVSTNNAVECDYHQPGTSADGALAVFNGSTNGLTEFTTAHFSGQLQGDLITASLDDNIYRIELNTAGTAATVSTLFNSAGLGPLDVIASASTDPFPGTIWMADHTESKIWVFEPNETLVCTGSYNAGLDEDGDNFDNADEIDNGADPCSSADYPQDVDGDFISDLNDPDDDNDGLFDTVDKFAIDFDNGTTTSIPFSYGWENDDPPRGGILGLGFTGMMTNGTSDYLSLFDIGKMTAGGAAGVLTVDEASEGDALGTLNTQDYGFQVGFNTATSGLDAFTVHSRVVGPFLGTTPTDFQSLGLFLGTGDQNNYVKVVASAEAGTGGVSTVLEIDGVTTSGQIDAVTMPGPEFIDLFLIVDKTGSTVQPAYAVTDVGGTGPLELLGSPISIPSTWLTNVNSGLAAGLISTSRGAAPEFSATWDFIEVLVGTPSCSLDTDCDDGNDCTTDVCTAGLCSNDSGADGSPCDDGATCTTGDICTDGVCAGGDDCPVYQGCEVGTGNCGTVGGDPDNDGLSGAADPCPSDPRNLCFGPVAVDQTSSLVLRINANSSASECAGPKTDCNLQVWSGDAGFNTGNNNVCNLNGGDESCIITGIDAIFGCDDESTEDLFQCYRWDSATAPELQYSFNVPNGGYLVNLFFANVYTGTTTGGSRVFDIMVEGNVAYPDFDPVSAANGSGIAVVRSKVVNVSDGNGLQIEFLHAVENPAIAAIEVLTAVQACTTNGECDDGNICNGAETCNPTVGCQPGTPLVCNNGNACDGTETCNPATGCQAGTPPVCNDGNVCNGTETCNTSVGCVAGTPLPCTDGNACNGAETCDVVLGCQAGTPLVCNDGDACNGLESCVPASGCQAGTPLNCNDGNPCTTDSCSAGVCVNTGSCPPSGSVGVDQTSIRSACEGSPGNTITIAGVPVGSQLDRILIATVGAEENDADCDLNLASAAATYGGIAMQKAATAVSNTSGYRACNGIFYLLNPPTGTANVVINFPTATTSAINDRHAGAFVIFNAAQQAPQSTASVGDNNGTNPVNTNITSLSAGAVVVDVSTRGELGSFTTTQAGQAERWDQSCGSSSSASSSKEVLSAGQTLLGWSHSGPNRYAHALAAFAPSGSGGGPTTTTSSTTTTTLTIGDGAAYLEITPTGGINASTYNTNSFSVRNDSLLGDYITQVRIDSSTAIFPDIVFDPAGIAGDKAAKCLVADTGEATTGFVTPANLCTTPFSAPHDDGYDVIDLFFTDFAPTETFKFSIDQDPTSIRGTNGNGGDSSGSISGLELTGATVTIYFDDGSVVEGQMFRTPNSQGGSRNLIKASPPVAPTISALGIAAPAVVTTAAQTIRVSGPVGASVRLLRVEGDMDLNGGTGYDIDPFEANTALVAAENSAVIGAGGFVDVPVTLTLTADDGFNYFIAAIVSTDGTSRTGLTSNVVVLQYAVAPQCVVDTDCDDANACTADTCASGVCSNIDTCGCVVDADCDDANSCTTDTCASGVCSNVNTCPGSTVQIDATSIQSACDGVAGDSITIANVPVGAQTNRILIVSVGAEEIDEDCDLSLATVTYGGAPMTLAKNEVSGLKSWRACNGIFYLLNPATGTADVVVTFPNAVGDQIDNRHAGAFVIYDAAQSAPVSTAGNGGNANPVNTAITVPGAGTLIVDVFTQGEIGTFTTQQAGQVKAWEQSCVSSSSASSTKAASFAGSTSMGWSHDKPKRFAHSIAAFAPAAGGGTTTTSTTTTTANPPTTTTTSTTTTTANPPTTTTTSTTTTTANPPTTTTTSTTTTTANPPTTTTTSTTTTSSSTTTTSTTTSTVTNSSLVCFVASTATTSLNGAMTTSAAYAGGSDNDPTLNSLASTLLFANSTSNANKGGSSDFATYGVTLPQTATWYLWGRFYYPGALNSNEANSFFASIDGGSIAKFGNKKDRFQQWHWDGDGNTELGADIALSLGTLGLGAHTIKIEKREVTPIPPRLDIVCLNQSSSVPPSDAAVKTLLGLP